MESWLFWGFVLLGVLLIGLGLGQMYGRQISSSPLSRRSYRPSSITDSMPGKHFRKPPSLSKQAHLERSRKNLAAEGLGSVGRSQPEKTAAGSMAAKPRQQVNPTVKQRPINHSRTVNPAIKRAQMKPSRRAKPNTGHPELISPEAIDPAFEQTQIRRAQQPKPAYDQAGAIPPRQQTDTADEQTQMRPSRLVKPTIPRSGSTFAEDTSS